MFVTTLVKNSLHPSLGQIARSSFCGDSIVWGRIPQATNLQPAIGQVAQNSEP
jgi:hypothetical protein